MNEITEFCTVKISGTVTNDIYTVVKNKDYIMHATGIQFSRLSDKTDRAVVHIKDASAKAVKAAENVVIDGTLRTYKTESGKSQTVVLAYNIDTDYNGQSVNSVELIGRIYSVRMTTSNGVKVCEARVEVVANYSKMSRITVVGWGVTADKLASLEKDTVVKVNGRLQSRSMKDAINETENLEVAVTALTVVH